MLRAAELFCDGKSQKAIARKLKMSAASVSRLLTLARRQGFIRVSLCPPTDLRASQKLEQLLAPFGIRRVIVAGQNTISVGQAAARFFEECSKRSVTVVLDGGATLAGFVKALVPRSYDKVRIVPICTDPPSYAVSAYELMMRMATTFPTVDCIKLPYATDRLLDSLHEHGRSVAQNADYVFLGAGPWSRGFTALEFVRHLGIEPISLKKQYPQVAAVCGYLAFDSCGKPIRLKKVDHRIRRALDYSDIRRLATTSCHVALVAATNRKAAAIRAVIKARLCNTLVLDSTLAEALIADAPFER